MGLIKCKACSEKVSTNAFSCPHCGEPVPKKKKTSLVIWLILILLVFYAIGNIAEKSIQQVNAKQNLINMKAIEEQKKIDKKLEITKKLAREKKILEIEKQRVENKKYFKNNRTSVLNEIKQLKKEEKYDEAIKQADLYLHSLDNTLLELKKSILVKDYVKKLKKIPAHEYEKNYKYYQELSLLRPSNKLYRKKARYYEARKLFNVDCGNQLSMYQFTLNQAMKNNPDMLDSYNYSFKAFNTAYGYAYTLFYQKEKWNKAKSVIVTLDNNCNILHVDNKPITTNFTLTQD